MRRFEFIRPGVYDAGVELRKMIRHEGRGCCLESARLDASKRAGCNPSELIEAPPK